MVGVYGVHGCICVSLPWVPSLVSPHGSPPGGVSGK